MSAFFEAGVGRTPPKVDSNFDWLNIYTFRLNDHILSAVFTQS